MVQATCGRCGEPLPESARFCPSCGLPIGGPTVEERRVVTVVFTDLVGSTALSSQIDPEVYREVIAAYYQLVTEELESFRGRAYNFAGDAVVGVFGIPHAHDDDALRAIRSGLAMVNRVGRVGAALGLPVPLRVRVGVNTGPVAIGSEAAERGLLFGAVVNAAARLQQSAEPDTVVVGETTWMLTRDRVGFDERREVEAKGFEAALPAFPVLSLGLGAARRTIQLVDRRRELRLLKDTFELAGQYRRGHMVTLLGEAGIGKSRVVEEFIDGLPEGTKVLLGRASSLEEDATFGPLAQILLQELGEHRDAPAERLRARLEELADACCPTDETPQFVARLGLALGLGGEEARDDAARYRVAEIRSGFLTLLDGLSRRGAVVLVLEDLHLAQQPMLDLVEQVVREAVRIPLLVLCVARTWFLDERPDWGGGLADSLTLYLEPMSLDDATLLARTAGEGLDEATADRVARHAGGNPFFIIETTGMLRHVEGHGQSGLSADTGPLPEELLPPTVQAVIASRIDHLPQAAKDLLRKSSVFGRSTFDVSELALIAEPDAEALSILEDEELLLREEERPDVWRFRHGLVRDVAYESLPKRERERLHLRVADELSADPHTASRYPRSVAYHLERAARASLDLRPEDRAVAERAVDGLAHAGDLALRASDGRAAAELLSRALALAGAQRSWGEREARILAGLGEARYWQGEFEAAVRPLERALDLAPADAAIRAQASRFLGDVELSVRGNRERAAELFATAIVAARELDDPWTLARSLLVAGWGPYWDDDREGARATFAEALEVARANPKGDAWAESRALAALATIVSETGDEEEALALASQGLAIAEGRGDRFSVAVARESVGACLRRMGRLDDAVIHADMAVDAFRELGARWELASALTARGITHRLSRRTEDAVRDLKEAFRLCRELNERSIVTWTAGAFVKALVDAGDLGTARQVLAEAASIANAQGPAPEDFLLDAEAEILLAEGDRERALAVALRRLAARRELDTKDAAFQVWWIARVFGPDAVGGEEEVQSARKLLVETHSQQAFLAADLPASR